MAIRYDSNYNAKINRVVKNFNQKRNRAIKRGFKNVPAPIKVSDLKARYTSRRELNKQLTQLTRFSRGGDAVLRQVENEGGATAIKWELDYLKANVKAARKFFADEYRTVAAKVGDFPGERMRLDAIAKKLSTLDLDLAYMSQSQFSSYRAAINEYINKPKSYAAGYRGFLAEVEGVMRLVGIPEGDIDKFFEKFKVLTPEQFHQLYENSDLIGRVYELADSPIYEGGLKLTTGKDEAKVLIDTLMEETDDLVDMAKQDFWLSKPPEIPKELKGNKIPKSSLTKEKISQLKALGWDDLIDETK